MVWAVPGNLPGKSHVQRIGSYLWLTSLTKFFSYVLLMISLDKLLDVRGITYGIMLVKSNRFRLSEAVHYNQSIFCSDCLDTRLRFDDIYSKNMRQFDEGKRK